MSEKEESYCYKYDGTQYSECSALEILLTDVFCAQTIAHVLVESHDVCDINNRTDQSSSIIPEGIVLIGNNEGDWYEIEVGGVFAIRPVTTPITRIRTVVEVLS